MTKKRRAGFTLVELMIVAAIVAILAAILVPLMSKNKESAVAAEGQSLAGAIMTAAKTQYARTGTFPTSKAALDDSILTDEVDSGSWTISSLSGPTDPAITVNTVSNNGYSGSVTLSDGDWTISLSAL